MSDLAKRIEELEGPDREVDAEIAESLGMCQHRRKTRSGCQDDTGFDCDDCGADSWGNRSKDGHNRRLHDPNPAYTKSLDAAMSLVPEGWRFRFGELLWVKTDGGQIKSCAKGGVAEMLATDVLSIGKASTPALALCAAAIRARESEGE